jgi:hypothetical protein
MPTLGSCAARMFTPGALQMCKKAEVLPQSACMVVCMVKMGDKVASAEH